METQDKQEWKSFFATIHATQLFTLISKPLSPSYSLTVDSAGSKPVVSQIFTFLYFNLNIGLGDNAGDQQEDSGLVEKVHFQ